MATIINPTKWWRDVEETTQPKEAVLPSDSFLSRDELVALPFDEIQSEHRTLVNIKVGLQCEYEKVLNYERTIQEIALAKLKETAGSMSIRIDGEIVTK